MAVYWGVYEFSIRIVGTLTGTLYGVKISMYVRWGRRTDLRLVVICIGSEVIGSPKNRHGVVSPSAFPERNYGVQISQSS
jgi:hypothetical protein